MPKEKVHNKTEKKIHQKKKKNGMFQKPIRRYVESVVKIFEHFWILVAMHKHVKTKREVNEERKKERKKKEVQRNLFVNIC